MLEGKRILPQYVLLGFGDLFLLTLCAGAQILQKQMDDILTQSFIFAGLDIVTANERVSREKNLSSNFIILLDSGYYFQLFIQENCVSCSLYTHENWGVRKLEVESA